MPTIYGSAVTSLSSAQHYLTSKLGKEKVRLLRSEWKDKFGSASILLLPNVNPLKSKKILECINTFKGVVLVFDSPLNLYGIPKLQWLDVQRGPSNLSYKFSFIPPDYERLLKFVNAKPEKKSIIYKNHDILAGLVTERTETQFLKLLHDFLYFCTSYNNRELTKRHVCESLRLNEKPALLYDKLKLYCSNDTDLGYLKALINYLKSDEGSVLRKTAYLIKKKKIKDYKSFAIKQGANYQDLKWLVKTVRMHKENTKWGDT